MQSATDTSAARCRQSATPRAAALSRLLDGDRLGQVARLVDVVAAGLGDPGGEHLQRDRRQQRLQKCRRRGDFDQMVGAPRAWISRMLDSSLAGNVAACFGEGITTITGRSSSINAIGPCLSSPAAKPSAIPRIAPVASLYVPGYVPRLGEAA